jgi:hypothetical protein
MSQSKREDTEFTVIPTPLPVSTLLSFVTILCDIVVVLVAYDNLFESCLYINNDYNIHNTYPLWLTVRYW